MPTETCTSCAVPNPAASSQASCDCSSSKAAQRPAKSAIAQTFGGVLVLAVGCLACCAPLIVPVIGLVVGTPLAALLTVSSGWLIGGLALLLTVGVTVGWSFFKKSAHQSA